MKCLVNIGSNLNYTIGEDVKYLGETVGKIISYDNDSGMATIQVDDKHKNTIMKSIDTNIGISSRKNTQ